MSNNNSESQFYKGGAIDIDKPLPDTNQALNVLNDKAHYQEQYKQFVKHGNVIHEKFNTFLNGRVKKAGYKLQRTLLATVIGISATVVYIEPISSYMTEKQTQAMNYLAQPMSFSLTREAEFVASLPPLVNVEALPKLSDIQQLINVMKEGLNKGGEIPPIITKGQLYMTNGTPSYVTFNDEIGQGVIITTASIDYAKNKVWVTLVMRKVDDKYKVKMYDPTGTIAINKAGLVDVKATEKLAELKQNKDALIEEMRDRRFTDNKEYDDFREKVDKSEQDLSDFMKKVRSNDSINTLLATRNSASISSFTAENSTVTFNTLVKNR